MANIIKLFENNINKVERIKKLSGGLSNDIYLINEKNIPYEQILAGRKHLKPIHAKHDDSQGEFDL